MTQQHSIVIEQAASLVGWISTAGIALILGSDDPRTGKQWCIRHEVPYVRDGKYNYARIDHVRAAFDKIASGAAGIVSIKDDVAESVRKMTG